MKQLILLSLALSLTLTTSGCSGMDFMNQIVALNDQILNQEDPPEEDEEEEEPTVYIAPDANNGNITSDLPYNPGANPGMMSLFGKWTVDVIMQKVNNPNGRHMTMKGKTVVIEPGGNYLPGQPVMSGNYLEDYSTEYIEPSFYRHWFNEVAGSATQSLGDAEGSYGDQFQNFQAVDFSQITCDHDGITQGEWKFYNVPYTTPAGDIVGELKIDFVQSGKANLTSRCGYNYNNDGANKIESSGWRSSPIGENNMYDGPFSMYYPYYLDSNFDTIILENQIWQIAMTRVH